MAFARMQRLFLVVKSFLKLRGFNYRIEVVLIL